MTNEWVNNPATVARVSEATAKMVAQVNKGITERSRREQDASLVANREFRGGRDGYVIAKALTYAIAQIQGLPKDRQEYSDMLDMCQLLQASELSRLIIERIFTGVEHHVQRQVDIYAAEHMDEVKG